MVDILVMRPDYHDIIFNVMVIIEAFILLFTFVALAKVVDLYFVESLEIISKRLRLSSDIAGATFMAMGSSAPELFVSILALFRASNESAIGPGTIVGSAIFNILVIIGASALFRRAMLTWQPVIRDLLFYIFCILVLLFTFRDGAITSSDAILFVGLYIVYLFSFKYWKKIFPYDVDTVVTEIPEDIAEAEPSTNPLMKILDRTVDVFFFDLERRPQFYLANFGISILLIGILTHFMVESAVGIAHFFHVPAVIIGLTILAAGTSVPDLLSSINVAKRGYGDMAIANAVGSNIFDIAIGLGLPWLFTTVINNNSLPVDTENLLSSVVLLFATVVALLFLLIARKWEVGRYAGILLIGLYVTYVLFQIGLFSMTFCVNILGSFCFSM
ncbi:calcium/sodium antiporter [candidate division WWE3 bacterium]|uniref:Calcium/sodium antiporter n=1 Tax=candidate division WWE3 bacterium TaxID=2053526 RepID=A0A955RWB3_UNCKA|nr:calcium/sodium antiporter [candidate division WWE3 bacterium]